MTTFYKHIGKCKNSGRRCVVVKNQIPNAEDKALIVDIDALPDAYQNFLMDLVQSNPAQRTNELGDVLARYQSPDSGMTMLMSLHSRQYMCQMPISNILMYPAPNYPIELSKVIDLVNGGDVETAKKNYSNDTLHRTVDNIRADEYERNEKVARNLIMEADRLAFEAQKKRDAAFAMAPQLNPASSTKISHDFGEQYNTNYNNHNNVQPQSNDWFSSSKSSPNVKVSDIGDKIGNAPAPVQPILTPEQAMLLKISQPDFVPPSSIYPLNESVEVKIEPTPKKTRRTRAKTKAKQN